MERLAGDPDVLTPRFIEAIEALRRKNGAKSAYSEMERAARVHWTTLRALLLSSEPEAQRIRSMAPLYVFLSESDRLDIIRQTGSDLSN
jgi:hypothetical protein